MRFRLWDRFKSRISPPRLRSAAAFLRLYQGKRAQIYKLDALFRREIARGTGSESGAGRQAQDGSLVQAGFTTRNKNVAAAPLSDQFRSLSWPISRTTPRSFTLCFSACARLATAAVAAAQTLVISDATSYFTRASPRSTFLCGSYDVGSAEENVEHPVTAARHKLTAAAATPIWMQRLMHTGGPGARCAACGNLAGGASF